MGRNNNQKNMLHPIQYQNRNQEWKVGWSTTAVKSPKQFPDGRGLKAMKVRDYLTLPLNRYAATRMAVSLSKRGATVLGTKMQASSLYYWTLITGQLLAALGLSWPHGRSHHTGTGSSGWFQRRVSSKIWFLVTTEMLRLSRLRIEC